MWTPSCTSDLQNPQAPCETKLRDEDFGLFLPQESYYPFLKVLETFHWPCTDHAHIYTF